MYEGSPTGLATPAATTLTGEAHYDYFGRGTPAVGDVNADGYDDVIIASFRDRDSGSAHVYQGSSTGLATIAATTLTGEGTHDYLGPVTPAVADVNADGYDDVIVTTWSYGGSIGRASAFHGSPGGLATTASTTLTGEADDDYFGRNTPAVGDVNADGYDDVIVTAYGYDDWTGRVYVYEGSPTGLSASAANRLTGESVYAYLGYHTPGVADLDLDGYADLLVPASGHDDGVVYVHYGVSGEDADGDGYPNTNDCDDADAAIHPGVTDTWYDGVDSDCSGGSDDDQDGDGDDALSAGGTDCDDTQATIYPGAYETLYDGIDSDCSGGSDYDRDGDGEDTLESGGTDCDDTDPTVNAAATETWYDGYDSDCSGGSDYDQDGDRRDAAAHGGTDCNDTDATISPSAHDFGGDGIDQDCDGRDAAVGEAPADCGCSSGASAGVASALVALGLLAVRRRPSA